MCSLHQSDDLSQDRGKVPLQEIALPFWMAIVFITVDIKYKQYYRTMN